MEAAPIWTISLASILLMLVRPRGLAEYIWTGSGALLLVALRLISPATALGAMREGVDVYLFLSGMMILAELAREEGVFDWVAEIAVRRARGSAGRLFFWVYVSGVVVTALLSNDATAVVLTPAVLAAVRRADVDSRPHLMACALVANAASFLLPISNPANLVVFASHLPALGGWLGALLLPSLVSIVVTFVVLRLISSRRLRRPAASAGEVRRLTRAGRFALAGIAFAAAAMLAASGLGIPLGWPTFGAALAAMALVASQDRSAPLTAVRHAAWSVLPLVASLFILVAALNQAGMMHAGQAAMAWLGQQPREAAKFAGAFAVALLSNGMNNLPVGLAAGSALRQAHHTGMLARAVLVGVDLGPNLSVTGSLATILWLIALRREQAEITASQFLKTGLVVMPAALALALLVLR
jgi:arsenical pump membrane protein